MCMYKRQNVPTGLNKKQRNKREGLADSRSTVTDLLEYPAATLETESYRPKDVHVHLHPQKEKTKEEMLGSLASLGEPRPALKMGKVGVKFRQRVGESK